MLCFKLNKNPNPFHPCSVCWCPQTLILTTLTTLLRLILALSLSHHQSNSPVSSLSFVSFSHSHSRVLVSSISLLLAASLTTTHGHCRSRLVSWPLSWPLSTALTSVQNELPVLVSISKYVFLLSFFFWALMLLVI